MENKFICKGWKTCKYSPYVNKRTHSKGEACCGFLTEHGFHSLRLDCNSILLTEEIELQVKIALGL